MPVNYQEATYRPPADGDWDSADPHFVARRRPCGKCGREFKTTAARRYFCGRCREMTKDRPPEATLISVAGNRGYGFGGVKGFGPQG